MKPHEVDSYVLALCEEHGKSVRSSAGYRYSVECGTNSISAAGQTLSCDFELLLSRGVTQGALLSSSTQALNTKLHAAMELWAGSSLLYHKPPTTLVVPAKTTLQFFWLPWQAIVDRLNGKELSADGWRALPAARDATGIAACVTQPKDNRVKRCMFRWLDHDTVLLVNSSAPLGTGDWYIATVKCFLDEFRFDIMALRPQTTATPTTQEVL